MAEIGKKRRATRGLEEATKRMRIETLSKFGMPPTIYEFNFKNTKRRLQGADNYKYYEEESDEDSNNDYEGYSDDVQSQNADTPLTPLSPPRRFPSDLKTIKCTYEGCSKSFNRPARLAAHLRSHTNERPFACSYAGCDKTYFEEKHLKQHIKGSHTHEKSYQCVWDGCSKSFLTATRLRRHREAHEGHDRFRCTAYPPCNQTFRKHQTLQRHIRADHLELAPFPCIYVDPDTQTACNAGFDSAGALRKHEDRIHGALRFWCDECSTADANHDQDIPPRIGFRTKNELTKHIRNEHSNCIFCDLKCGSQVELQRHIEAQHSSNGVAEPSTTLSERKTVLCTFSGCSKAFTKKYNLDVHIRSAHNGQRFTCSPVSTTSNTFKSPEIAVWTGINACGKDFVSKINLEDHIRTQHLGLPSVLNAKRPKSETSRKKDKKTSSNQRDDTDVINLLTGAGYTQDPTRNIPCLIPACQYLFTRHYDLDLHLKSAHNLSTFEVESSTAVPHLPDPSLDDPNDRKSLEAMYDQADLEWDMHHTATTSSQEASPFWVGARDEDELSGEARDIWEQEQEEMRTLCDREGEWDGLLDPELMGM
jgi:general transcription factor IIIA